MSSVPACGLVAGALEGPDLLVDPGREAAWSIPVPAAALQAVDYRNGFLAAAVATDPLEVDVVVFRR